MRFRPDFVAALAGHDLNELDRVAGTVFALDRDLVLAYTNAAWDRFARDNGGDPERWCVARPVLDAICGPLRGFYDRAYHAVLADNAVWSFDYECSSPAEHRVFHLTAYPLPSRAGVLVVNAIAAVRAHDRVASTGDAEGYVDSDGVIGQCSHCRYVRHPGVLERWDWLPELVARPDPRTSHGLCVACLGHYYPA